MIESESDHPPFDAAFQFENDHRKVPLAWVSVSRAAREGGGGPKGLIASIDQSRSS
jgi:hypothetical protein